MKGLVSEISVRLGDRREMGAEPYTIHTTLPSILLPEFTLFLMNYVSVTSLVYSKPTSEPRV